MQLRPHGVTCKLDQEIKFYTDGLFQPTGIKFNGKTAFIREIGLPTTFTEMGITDESVLRAAADTGNLTAGCCKKFDREEMFQLLKGCL